MPDDLDRLSAQESRREVLEAVVSESRFVGGEVTISVAEAVRQLKAYYGYTDKRIAELRRRAQERKKR